MIRKKLLRNMAVLGLVLVTLISGVGCGNQSSSNSSSSSAGSSAPGKDSKAVGFIFVGTRDDYGYNQAAYEGSLAVEKDNPGVKVLRAENVPETEEASRAMEEMIKQGAKIIFPTSYGHLDPALEVAKNNSDVVFFHQGGLKTSVNLGTYFGDIWQSVYLCGIAAAKATKTNKLGYVVSFPIPQVLLNINAFELGAQSVNPNITTSVVFTGSWADPGAQANAANSLIDSGVDVITQHQDATKTIIEIAEKRGIKTIGYHVDASKLAPNAWLTGSIWNWSKLYDEMTKVALSGKFKGSKFDGKYRGGLKDGIVDLASFGKSVPDDVKTLINSKKQDIIDGKLSPFKGPIYKQDGSIAIKEGENPSTDKLESMDYLVKGVIGNIPKSN